MLVNRTTCSAEAINKVIGNGIPGNSNFFSFVFYIQKFELARSLKLRNMTSRCIFRRRRDVKNHKHVVIRNASELLEKNEISVDEFLDNIAKFKYNEVRQTKQSKVLFVYSSDEEEDDDESHQAVQPPSKRMRADSINLCRVCNLNESNVITIPCSHAVHCFECWTKKSLQDDKYCAECYAEVKSVVKFN